MHESNCYFSILSLRESSSSQLKTIKTKCDDLAQQRRVPCSGFIFIDIKWVTNGSWEWAPGAKRRFLFCLLRNYLENNEILCTFQ